MDYTELHLHLDGSMRAETLTALAADAGVTLPDKIHFFPGIGLEEALSRFGTTVACLQTTDSIRRVAKEICADATACGVTTLEIRFAPQLHPVAPPEEIVDAALDGIDGRAGLILCGLYGEAPSILNNHVEIARTRNGVVGIDLAGAPHFSHQWNIADYSEPFGRALDLGIGRTVHAGEGGRPPEEIRQAIELLHAQRIGHGTSLLEDPSVVELVINKEVVVEACPTSNMQTGIISSVSSHPLPKWLELGVRACVNCDNWLLSDIDPVEEYRRALSIPDMTDTLLAQCVETGRKAAFRS
jgi:adenosine deaminase